MGPIFHEQNAISPFQSTAYCENKDLKVVVHVYRVEMNGFYRTPDIWRGNHTFATKRSEISPIKRANLLTITTTPKNWNNRKELTPTSRSFYTRKGLWVDNSNDQRDLFFNRKRKNFSPSIVAWRTHKYYQAEENSLYCSLKKRNISSMSPYCQINMQHTIDKQIKRKEGGFRNSIGNNIIFFSYV